MPPETMTMNAPTAKMPGTTSAESLSTMLLGVKNCPERISISTHKTSSTRKMYGSLRRESFFKYLCISTPP